jgi:periplasmic divalent cation tolerance protein
MKGHRKMTAFVFVYMTAKDRRQALRIGRALVERELAACVNILGASRSIYRWQGKICDDREIAFIAKTRRSLLPKLTAAVRELHSYECPCIVALPVAGGSTGFLRWIAAQTTGYSSRRLPPSSPARTRK